MIKIYFDGGCGPKNPGGTATFGYLVFDEDVLLKAACGVVGTGRQMTNNVAEFSGLLNALKAVKEEGLLGNIMIIGDSQLVLKIVSGEWSAGSHTCQTFLPRIQELLKGHQYRFRHISGSENFVAHGLCKAALRRHNLK